MKKVLDIFQEELTKLLAEKTSFGRNDLLLLIEKAKVNTLCRLLEEKEIK